MSYFYIAECRFLIFCFDFKIGNRRSKIENVFT